jgi:hypothetical protein
MLALRSTPSVAVLVGLVGLASAGCSTASAAPAHVVAAPPPKDDGRPSKGAPTAAGVVHSAALEQLQTAPLEARTDKQNSIRMLLPDAANWTRVKFWGVESLVGFRYGKDHHAVAGAFVTHDDDAAKPGACSKSVEKWAAPFVRAFEVDISFEEPAAFPWQGTIADVDRVFARTATLTAQDGYAVAYGAYPAWKGACLVVGIAVPTRDDEARARKVRDRFAAEVLPKVERLMLEEPKERY